MSHATNGTRFSNKAAMKATFRARRSNLAIASVAFMRVCPNWECSIASRSPPWPGWPRLTAIVENCAAAVVSGADARRSGASCIWRQWRESVAIPPSELLSAAACQRKARQARALTACMRKLLVILNAMLHNKTHCHTPALTSSTSALFPLLGARTRLLLDHCCKQLPLRALDCVVECPCEL